MWRVSSLCTSLVVMGNGNMQQNDSVHPRTRNDIFFVIFCFAGTSNDKKLEFASAPPGDHAASSVSWSDRALRRKFTSGASATGPVS